MIFLFHVSPFFVDWYCTVAIIIVIPYSLLLLLIRIDPFNELITERQCLRNIQNNIQEALELDSNDAQKNNWVSLTLTSENSFSYRGSKVGWMNHNSLEIFYSISSTHK